MEETTIPRNEIIQVADIVAREKSIDKELVIGSMESAIQKAALTKFGNDNNIEVVIDRETGEIKIKKVNGIVYINEAEVVTADVEVSNGVIHYINRVLQPLK